METWLFWALLSPAVFTGVNYIDKYVVERQVREPLALATVAAIVGLVFGLVLWLITGVTLLPLRDGLLILLSGVFTYVAALFYFSALKGQQTTTIVVMLQSVPVFVLVLSWLVLGETINARQMVGFALILGATIFASIDGNAVGGLRLTRTFWLILGTATAAALSIVIFKLVVGRYAFAPVVAYESIGIGLAGAVAITVWTPLRNVFLREMGGAPLYKWAIVTGSEGAYVGSKMITFMAVSLGPTALVSVINSTQVFFALLYGFVLNIFAPQIFAEANSGRQWLRKGGLAALMLVGIVLVQ